MAKRVYIYQDAIDKIIAACNDFVAEKIEIVDLQKVIREGEREIVAFEERDIREFLTSIEGRIEFALFALSSRERLIEVRQIAKDVAAWLRK